MALEFTVEIFQQIKGKGAAAEVSKTAAALKQAGSAASTFETDLASLKSAIQSDKQALTLLNSEMRRMKRSGADEASADFQQLKGQIDATSASISRNVQQFARLRSAQQKVAAMGPQLGTALRKQESSIRRTGGAMRGTSAAAKKWNANVAANVPQATKAIKSNADQATTSVSKLSSVFTAAKVAIAGMAIAAVTTLGRLGAALLQSVGAAGAFRESMTFSLTKFLGDAKSAQVELGKVRQTSDQLGVSFESAADQFKSFISAGFTKEQSQNLVKFRADVEALSSGSEKATERIQEGFIQIEKAMATGRFEADGFNSVLSNVPVTKMQVLERLSKLTGKSLEKLKKTDITKLPVKETIQAFQDAMKSAVGASELGETAAKKATSTAAGMFKVLKNRARNTFDDIAIRVADRMGDIKPAMQQLLDAFDSDTAKAAMDLIAEGIVSLVREAAEAIPKVLKLTDGLISGFNAAREVLGPVNKLLASTGDSAENSTSGWQSAGQAIGAVVGALGTLWQIGKLLISNNPLISFTTSTIEVMSGGVAAIKAVPGQILASIGEFFEAGAELGRQVINGLANMIRAGVSNVVSAISDTAQSAVDAAKSVLKIASPSKVFEGIGEQTTEGFAQGISAGQRDAQSALSSLVAPPQLGGGSAGGGGGVSLTINVGDVSGVQNAEQLADMLEARLAAVLERVNVGQGVTA